jgi:hypothetical protein
MQPLSVGNHQERRTAPENDDNYRLTDLPPVSMVLIRYESLSSLTFDHNC